MVSAVVRGPTVRLSAFSLCEDGVSLSVRLSAEYVHCDLKSGLWMVEGVRTLVDGVAWPVATTSPRITSNGALSVIFFIGIFYDRSVENFVEVRDGRSVETRARFRNSTPDPSIRGLEPRHICYC